MSEPATTDSSLEAVAVVGMAARFPGAAGIEEFWRNLRDGVESIARFSDEELRQAGVEPELLRDSRYVKARGALDGVDLFDAALFGISPREAEILDPQHRLFLECAFEALENAGYDTTRYRGSVGIFGGTGMSSYLWNLSSNRELLRSVGAYQVMLGNDKDFLTTRVAYKLDLRGPSITVQTACSTSLVAVHLACQSLLSRECELALAGGVSLSLPERAGYLYEEQGIFSADGHCRAFDAAATGTVGGSGVGIVVLKRLSAALEEGDNILAVVRGTAVNNDGSLKVSYTAPSVQAQSQVVAEALAVAGVEPEEIGFVEAHGTGTALGDPIEVAALARAFRTSRRGFCALGAVKTNIGHLDEAAGIAGFIKAVLALLHGQIPPTLHFSTANAQIDFASCPFYVNTALAEWPRRSGPRLAGVSSLGIGGTNAHVVLEEAPEPAPAGPARPSSLLVLSARTPAALDTVTGSLAGYLRDHPEADLADVAYTLQVGRRAWPHRRMVVANNREEAAAALAAQSPEQVFSRLAADEERPVFFLFSGQGAQHAGMGRELYAQEPTFREWVDRCCDLLREPLGLDLRSVIHPVDDLAQKGAASLEQTWLAQPALFTVELALAKLWMEWGIVPRAMLGHSIGEYVAACLAGVLSLEDALRLVAARGKLMQRLPAGAMLAVPMSPEEIAPLLPAGVSLAAINGPALCTVSGAAAAVEALERDLAGRGVEHRRLHTSHAFHSALVEPVLEEFRREVAKVRLRPGRIPYIANVGGGWQTEQGATDPGYWVRHLRDTVRFADGLDLLLREPRAALLEVGPGNGLASLAKRHPGHGHDHLVVASLPHPQDAQSDARFLLGTLGQLWLGGVAIDWQGFHRRERRRRLALPPSPLERQRYWVERQTGEAASVRRREEPSGESRLYVPAWSQSPAPALKPEALAAAPSCWLLLLDESGFGEELAQRLAAAGREVVRVVRGPRFEKAGGGLFVLDPLDEGGYGELFQELARSGRLPARIVHLWSLATAGHDGSVAEAFHPLLFLVRALARQDGMAPFDLAVISSHVQPVSGDEPLLPERASFLALCRVVPQEIPNIACRTFDVTLPPAASAERARLVERLLADLLRETPEHSVAYRGSQRWVQRFRALPAGKESEGIRLRPRGTYLITGGLGRIGLVLAELLAREAQARLVLVGRSANPVAERVLALEALGAEVLVMAADVADREAMSAVLSETRRRFGDVHGIIHAAGVLGGFDTVREIDRAACEAQLLPKVKGLAILDELLADQPLDFVVLCSSLSTILGGLGFAPYAAANLVMDAFAHWRSRSSSTPWISIDWDGWRRDDSSAPDDQALAPEEGARAFLRILQLAPGPQVVVAVGDLEARIDRWVRLRHPEDRPAPPEAHTRPALSSPYAAPGSDMEEELVRIWEELLGIHPVGVHDNFFDLGGHSLLGVQLSARLRRSFEIDLPLRALFENPTIARLAEICELEIIRQIEQLDETGALHLLAEVSGERTGEQNG